LIEQLVPAATEDPQLLVCEKSPETAMLTLSKSAVPFEDSVMTCGALAVLTIWSAKVSDAGDKDTPGTSGRIPEPDKLTDWVPALSLMLIDAEFSPARVGANIALIEQLAPTAREAGQSLDCEKPLPRIEMLDTSNGAVPVEVSVTDSSALNEPTVVSGKESAETDKDSPGAGGATPNPDKLINCGLEAASSTILSDAAAL